MKYNSIIVLIPLILGNKTENDTKDELPVDPRFPAVSDPQCLLYTGITGLLALHLSKPLYKAGLLEIKLLENFDFIKMIHNEDDLNEQWKYFGPVWQYSTCNILCDSLKAGQKQSNYCKLRRTAIVDDFNKGNKNETQQKEFKKILDQGFNIAVLAARALEAKYAFIRHLTDMEFKLIYEEEALQGPDAELAVENAKISLERPEIQFLLKYRPDLVFEVCKEVNEIIMDMMNEVVMSHSDQGPDARRVIFHVVTRLEEILDDVLAFLALEERVNDNKLKSEMSEDELGLYEEMKEEFNVKEVKKHERAELRFKKKLEKLKTEAKKDEKPEKIKVYSLKEMEDYLNNMDFTAGDDGKPLDGPVKNVMDRFEIMFDQEEERRKFAERRFEYEHEDAKVYTMKEEL